MTRIAADPRPHGYAPHLDGAVRRHSHIVVLNLTFIFSLSVSLDPSCILSLPEPVWHMRRKWTDWLFGISW